jgi:hypothetical protein
MRIRDYIISWFYGGKRTSDEIYYLHERIAELEKFLIDREAE